MWVCEGDSGALFDVGDLGLPESGRLDLALNLELNEPSPAYTSSTGTTTTY